MHTHVLCQIVLLYVEIQQMSNTQHSFEMKWNLRVHKLYEF